MPTDVLLEIATIVTVVLLLKMTKRMFPPVSSKLKCFSCLPFKWRPSNLCRAKLLIYLENTFLKYKTNYPLFSREWRIIQTSKTKILHPTKLDIMVTII